MTPYTPIVAALVTLLIITIILTSKAGKHLLDIPNARSLHHAPIPRIGGIGIMAGVLSAWALLPVVDIWWIIVPVLFLFCVSLLDDLRGLPVGLRLLAHLLAALLLLFGSGMVATHIGLALLLLPCVIWMANLYNFMDGSDGLAGGMTFFGFTVYGFAALMHGDDTLALLNFAIAAAALGFLYYNLFPARVFMGDSGSIPLGFLAAAMGLRGWQLGHWSGWFPLLVFMPFIADASVTLLKRSVGGKKITEAHREHYYQRLVQLGWGHRTVALLSFALMFAAGISALWALHFSTEFPWLLFLLWGSFYILVMRVMDKRWKIFQQGRCNQDG
jgi:UDP-N-acetylmuramyl pentapeptide phosphotransferase/UDP-N-acetylglucosamine-1-phosphate transferase